jgi:hypothetical protein
MEQQGSFPKDSATAGARMHNLMDSIIKGLESKRNPFDFIQALPTKRKLPQGIPANIGKGKFYNPFDGIKKVVFDYNEIESHCPSMFAHIMQDKFKPRVEKISDSWELVVDVKVLDFDCNVTMSCPIHGLIRYQDENFTFEIEDDIIYITTID